MARMYSVYNRKTDQPIFIHGTAAQCAKALGITVRTFYKQIGRSRVGLAPQRYEIIIDPIDDEEEE